MELGPAFHLRMGCRYVFRWKAAGAGRQVPGLVLQEDFQSSSVLVALEAEEIESAVPVSVRQSRRRQPAVLGKKSPSGAFLVRWQRQNQIGERLFLPADGNADLPTPAGRLARGAPPQTRRDARSQLILVRALTSFM